MKIICRYCLVPVIRGTLLEHVCKEHKEEVQTNLFDYLDITSNNHHGNSYSSEANASITERKHKIRTLVYRFIESKKHYGATSDEVEQALGLSHQTASARMTELKALKMINDSGLSRKTRSHRKAGVWVTGGR